MSGAEWLTFVGYLLLGFGLGRSLFRTVGQAANVRARSTISHVRLRVRLPVVGASPHAPAPVEPYDWRRSDDPYLVDI